MIVHNYLWSGAAGSMGGATFQKWKGKQTVRTKPTSVENPQTPAQMFNRAKFAILTILARLFRPAVLAGMKEQATDMTEYNAFVKYNIRTAIEGTTASEVAIDYPELVISRGTAPIGQVVSVGLNMGNVAVEYYALPNDPIPDGSVLHVVCYNPTTDQLAFGYLNFIGGVVDGTFQSPFSTLDGVFSYFFYVNAATGKVSDSIFIDGEM